MYFITLKKNIAKFFIIGVFILLFIVYVYKVVNLNINSRKCKYLDYNNGQKFEYKDCSISLDNLCIYDLDEFIEEYGTSEEFFKGYGDSENYKIITIDYEFEKKIDKALGVDWTEAYLLTETWFNQFDIVIFDEINNIKPYSDIKKDEIITYTIPFIINKSTITKKQWNDIDDMDFWIELPDYNESQYIRRINI